MIRIFTRQIEKLGTEDGQALVFVALVGLVIFLFFSMTMNVADLVNTKIKNQNVADAAALSAAVWQARTLNLISAANRSMLEQWVLFGVLAAGLGLTTWICAEICGGFAISPFPCILCIVLTAAVALGALSTGAAAINNGAFQDEVLQGIDMDVVAPDLDDYVVPENYAFKPNTSGDDVGLYLHYPTEANALLRAYVPGDLEAGDYALERVGLCATLIMGLRYGNYLYHLYDEDVTRGLSDVQWQELLPEIEALYSPGGQCYQQIGLPSNPPPQLTAVFPLGLRSRDSAWGIQNVDSVLAMTVATYKAQEPPPALGKGTDAADCVSVPGDTQFGCPNIRHYAFASAHAYSKSASEFYNTDAASLDSAFLIPYVPFVMDWEPRLFPVDGQAYRDLAILIDADSPGDGYVLERNLLQLNGMDFFLY